MRIISCFLVDHKKIVETKNEAGNIETHLKLKFPIETIPWRIFRSKHINIGEIMYWKINLFQSTGRLLFWIFLEWHIIFSYIFHIFKNS